MPASPTTVEPPSKTMPSYLLTALKINSGPGSFARAAVQRAYQTLLPEEALTVEEIDAALVTTGKTPNWELALSSSQSRGAGIDPTGPLITLGDVSAQVNVRRYETEYRRDGLQISLNEFIEYFENNFSELDDGLSVDDVQDALVDYLSSFDAWEDLAVVDTIGHDYEIDSYDSCHVSWDDACNIHDALLETQYAR